MLLAPLTAQACDVCGCSIAGGGFGLVSGATRHFVGVGYAHVGYDNDVAPVRDRLHRYQLVGQATLRDYWRVRVSLPYHHNVRLDERTETLTASGFGDVELHVSYAAVDRRLDGGGRALVLLGGGAQLPTGKFDRRIARRNLPEDFNPGRGALVPHLELRAQLTGDRWGVLAQARTERPLANDAGYRYGQRVSAQLRGLRRFATQQAGIVATAGLAYSHVGESLREESGDGLHGSGGEALLSTLGIQLERNAHALGLNAGLPHRERFAEDATATTFSLDLNLIRTF